MIAIFIIVVIVITGAIFYRFYRYRFISFVQYGYTEDMCPFSLEGYTDKLFYFEGEEISFFIHSETEHGEAMVYHYNDKTTSLAEFSFDKVIQPHSPSDSEEGCQWTRTYTLPLDKKFAAGYYVCRLSSRDSDNHFEIYFIVGSRTPKKIVVVAPIGTWTAYNAWGGKSLYQNSREAKTVYSVSTKRPNAAFPDKHNLEVEANVFHWFFRNYDGASIVPDYALESNPELFAECELIIIAYHNEYISRGSYDGLLELLKRKIPMISLGANQFYWNVKWNSAHTQMECHKDLTRFEHSKEYGGMWKHHFRLPEKLFGVGYNGLGMHTFAPYRVSDASHWLYEGTDVKNNDLFGITGVSNRPISGAETDKITRFSLHIEIIAKGMNCASETQGIVYDGNESIWNGEGGGDFVLLKHQNGSTVLSTSSIESGAGLGVDSVFTQIIQNFIARVGVKKTEHGN